MAYDRRGEKHQKSLQHKLDAMKTRLEELEADLLSHPKPKSIKGLKFAESPLASSIAIELDHAGKSYGSKVLFSGFCKGDRILVTGPNGCVTGPNGCGKTTLLKTIAGMIPLDEGSIRSAPTAKIAFLDQEVELLPMDQTPLQYFESRFHIDEETLRRELHKAALGGSRPHKTIVFYIEHRTKKADDASCPSAGKTQRSLIGRADEPSGLHYFGSL